MGTNIDTFEHLSALVDGLQRRIAGYTIAGKAQSSERIDFSARLNAIKKRLTTLDSIMATLNKGEYGEGTHRGGFYQAEVTVRPSITFDLEAFREATPEEIWKPFERPSKDKISISYAPVA